LHNNTCQWRSKEGVNSFMFGMPYDVHVKAENHLGSVNSELHRVHTRMIGRSHLAVIQGEFLVHLVSR